MPYITPNEVRVLTNITTEDLSDTQINAILPYCTAQVNRDIITRVIREKIEYIDNHRENKIDGSNTYYYVSNWKGKYIADYNDDGTVNASDVVVTQVDSNGDETTLTVSSVDSSACKITLSTAPVSGVTLYVTYNFAKVPATNLLLKLATAYLVAAVGFAKMNLGAPSSFSVGEIRVTTNSNSFKTYYESYSSVIRQINDDILEEVQLDLVM